MDESVRLKTIKYNSIKTSLIVLVHNIILTIHGTTNILRLQLLRATHFVSTRENGFPKCLISVHRLTRIYILSIFTFHKVARQL